MKNLILSLCMLGVCVVVFGRPDGGQESEIESEEVEEEEAKRPYSFSWAASRYYHGAPDREHQEQRGEDGITRGVFRYVDPRQKVQEVVYYADDDGFHVDASNLPKDTLAVVNARSSHANEFERIRQEHARISAERAIQEAQEREESSDYEQFVDPIQHRQELIKNLPKETYAVENLRAQHASLFETIREEHARIAAEQEEQQGEENYQFVDPIQHRQELIKSLPKETYAVENLRAQRAILFERIKEEHARIAAEREQEAQQEEENYQFVDPVQHHQELIKSLPKETYAVEKLRAHHATLFKRISEEHAHLAAEREQEEQQEENYQ